MARAIDEEALLAAPAAKTGSPVGSPVGSLVCMAPDMSAAAEQPRDDESEDSHPVGTILRLVAEDMTVAVEQNGDNSAEANASLEMSEGQVEEVLSEAREIQETTQGPRQWNVDTSYIDRRTADPNCLKVRRAALAESSGGGVAVAGTGVGAAATSLSTRGQDGKWQVDMSYINHRTGEVDNLEGRRTALAANAEGTDCGGEQVAGQPSSAPPSATVRHEDDGRWRVDTSYIGYRTADPNNMRRDDSVAQKDQFADPVEKKYDYETLKAGNPRPADVDPTCKERYLIEEEFHTLFSMEYDDFTKLPKWKQINIKKSKQLF